MRLTSLTRLSVPTLAAPAFAAAVFGNRIQALFTAGSRPFVVVDLVVSDAAAHLNGKSLRALAIDFALLPVALAGHDLPTLRRYRLKVGDKLTVVAELPDYERLLRLQRPPAVHRVLVESYPITAKEALLPLVRTIRNCTQEDAATILNGTAFTLAEELTFGEARELIEQLEREKVNARIA